MSHPFLPLSSPPDSPDSPGLRPRRPSLDPEREILSTRGQRFLNFLPSRNSSSALQELHQESTFLRRGSQLIGRSNPRYEWYVMGAFLRMNTTSEIIATDFFLFSLFSPGNAIIEPQIL
jgi:hypothetical protein